MFVWSQKCQKWKSGLESPLDPLHQFIPFFLPCQCQHEHQVKWDFGFPTLKGYFEAFKEGSTSVVEKQGGNFVGLGYKILGLPITHWDGSHGVSSEKSQHTVQWVYPLTYSSQNIQERSVPTMHISLCFIVPGRRTLIASIYMSLFCQQLLSVP